VSGSHALPPRWPPQCSCVVIESSFDPGERLQAPGSLWFNIISSISKGVIICIVIQRIKDIIKKNIKKYCNLVSVFSLSLSLSLVLVYIHEYETSRPHDNLTCLQKRQQIVSEISVRLFESHSLISHRTLN
jgi:hypothetical protein